MEGCWLNFLVKPTGLYWLLLFLLNPQAHLLYLLNMRHLLTALLLLPKLVLAQQLHTFKNGEVADAEKINENFQTLQTDIQPLKKNLSISSDLESTEVSTARTKSALSEGLTFTSTEYIWTTVQTIVEPRQISTGEYEERTLEGSLTQDGWNFKTFSKTWLRYPPIANHPKCSEGDIGFPLQYQFTAYTNRGAILLESVDQTNGIDPEEDPEGFDSAFINDLSSPEASVACIGLTSGSNALYISVNYSGTGIFRCASGSFTREESGETLPNFQAPSTTETELKISPFFSLETKDETSGIAPLSGVTVPTSC